MSAITMPAMLAIGVSIALPWLLGATAIHVFTRRLPFGALLALGYGYLAGAFMVTLVLRVLSLAHVTWTLPVVALPVAALALGAAWLQRGTDWRARWRDAHAAWNGLAPPLRVLFVVALVLIVVRALGLALEVAWRPVQPWDAWSHWATKARVWFEYGRMVPFVAPNEWLTRGELMAFTDQQPGYPGTVPLLQVWTNLCLGSWHDAWMNAPWPALFASFGIAVYAQARRAEVPPAAAMIFAWLVLSLPFLDVHVALAGMADIFLAAALGMVAMAMAQAVRTRAWVDIGLAVVMGVIAASIKVEGMIWLLAFLPGVIVAVRPRLGLRLVLIGVVVAIAYLAFGPPRLRLFGYTLRTQFTNVSLPLMQHMFVMDNWHLFWYAAIACIAWQWRRLLESTVAPMSVAMLGGAAFVAVVFFFSNAGGGVDDETLVNRLLLHFVPALAFYLLLLVRPTLAAPVGAAKPAAAATT
ncbi:MAG: hypothetical protein ABI920_11945 [Casimicrobiaceae bacterium]